MTRDRSVAATCAVVLVMAPAAAAQESVSGGLEAPSVHGGDYDAAHLAVLLRARPMYARLRLRLDLWSSIDDMARRGPRDLRLLGDGGVYDELIERLRRAGIRVILTVGVDAAGLSPAELSTPSARVAYARTLRALALRYRGRVHALELEDLPNLRAPGETAPIDRIPAANYAALLVSAQTELRALEGVLHCEMPRVLVGGLLDAPPREVGTIAENYLRALHDHLAMTPGAAALQANGREVIEDLAVQVRAERVPGLTDDWLAAGARGLLFSVHILHRDFLSPRRAPRVWVTAGAYRTDGTEAEDFRQSLEAVSYFSPRHYADAPIRPELLAWSPLNEPAPSCGGLGLYRRCEVLNENARLGLSTVLGAMQHWRPAPNARIEFSDRRLTLVAGQRAQVFLRVTNDGPSLSSIEPWREDTQLWIVPALGCPDGPVVNMLPWVDLPAGSVNSGLPGGARVRYVPVGAQPPAVTLVATWHLSAPRDLPPGAYTVAARMQQRDRSFGNVATLEVDVVAPPMMDAGASDAPDAPERMDAIDVSDVVDGSVAPDLPRSADLWELPDTTDAVSTEAPASAPDVPPLDRPAPLDAGRLMDASRPPSEVRYELRCAAGRATGVRARPWVLILLGAFARRLRARFRVESGRERKHERDRTNQ